MYFLIRETINTCWVIIVSVGMLCVVALQVFEEMSTSKYKDKKKLIHFILHGSMVQILESIFYIVPGSDVR